MATKPAHLEILEAAIRICSERRNWTFVPLEIVRALPQLDASTVRTHITSRCCVNAPQHHADKLSYFRRVGRGRYEILPTLRRRVARRTFAIRSDNMLRDTVHAVVSRSGDMYVIECLEVAVVTQGHTFDEALANVQDALNLHLDGEDPASFGLTPHPRLSVTYETALAV